MQAGFQLSRASPYHYVKRMCDIILSGLLLIICAPLMAMIAALIWLTSGRPVIFKQHRVGGTKQFSRLTKFRTMRANRGQRTEDGDREQRTEVREADLYTRENDPRVLPVGRWLRKLRIDELPQLWNVFHGELSLIGPRAEWVECAERYRDKIPFYHFRHLVKPGITGWAQVNYPYGESEEDAMQKLTYDLYYIRHYSLKLDAMIVLKTIYTMFAGAAAESAPVINYPLSNCRTGAAPADPGMASGNACPTTTKFPDLSFRTCSHALRAARTHLRDAATING